jgi:transposase
MDLSKLHLDWGASKYKGKVYRTYSLARSLWIDGKNKKETVIKLGKLSDDQVIKWRSLLKAFKDPNAFVTSFEDICTEKHFSYLDVAVANAIWDEWGLDKIFHNNGRRHISIAAIARILTINRCIDPVAKSKTPEWFRNTALIWMLDINPKEIYPSRIFRELAVIETHKDAICKHLFTQFNQLDSASMKSVFYDLSSTSFEGTKCKLMKWGHCKGGYENHVVLALLVNKNGLPFYWEVLPGCTADSTTISWLQERILKKFNIAKTTLVFDRGMVSDDNLALLEGDKIKYISAMDRNQIENITKIDFTKYSYLLPEKIDEQVEILPKFQKMNENTFYREIKVDGQRRYILCFNPQLFKDQRKAREQALANFHLLASNLNAELLEAKNSRQEQPTYAKFQKKLEKAKLNNFADVTLIEKYVYPLVENENRKIRTYQAEVVVDDDKRLLAGKLDGFWLLVTNHSEKTDQEFTVKTEDAINPYREKEIIEEAFKNIKSFIKIEPMFVWTEDHVKAHYTICVLSYLINRTLTLRLHTNKGKTTKDMVAHARLMKECSECKLDYIEVENIQQKNFNLTKPTAKQKELLERVGLQSLINRRILEKANKNLNYA